MTCQEELEQLIPVNDKTETSFLIGLKNLLPTGALWGFNIIKNVEGLIADTELGIFLSCIANELYRFRVRWNDLFRESIGGLSEELLPEWENEVGLTTVCGIASNTLPLAERQCAVHAHFFTDRSNAMKTQWYIDYAYALGYEITIEEFTEELVPFELADIGTEGDNLGSSVGDRLNQSTIVSAVIITIVSGPNSEEEIARFKCRMRDIKASHIVYVWEVEEPSGVEIGGRYYNTIEIGSLEWMSENLAYENAPYLWPDNDVSKIEEFGLLYPFSQALALVPEGWRLPVEADFDALKLVVGGSTNEEGKELKLNDESQWPTDENRGLDPFGWGGQSAGEVYGLTKETGIIAINTTISGGWWTGTFNHEYGGLDYYRVFKLKDALDSFIPYLEAIDYNNANQRNFSVRYVRDI